MEFFRRMENIVFSVVTKKLSSFKVLKSKMHILIDQDVFGIEWAVEKAEVVVGLLDEAYDLRSVHLGYVFWKHLSLAESYNISKSSIRKVVFDLVQEHFVVVLHPVFGVLLLGEIINKDFVVLHCVGEPHQLLSN